MSNKRITFRQLKRLVMDRPPNEVDPNTHPHLAAALPSAVSHANLESALNGFLCELEISWDDEIRATLRDEFAKLLDVHLSHLPDQGRPPSFIKNRKHLLTRWHKIVRALDHDRSSVNGELTPLQDALKKLIGNASIRSIARAASVPVPSLRRWLDGQVPQPSKAFYLSRLEEHFELDSRQLMNLLPVRIGARPLTPGVDSGPPNKYRSDLSWKVRKRYRLTSKTTPEHVRKEWIGLLRHKTGLSGIASSVSGLLKTTSKLSNALHKGDSRKTWRTRNADPFDVQHHNAWYHILDGLWIPTADRCFNEMASYLGWATYTPDDGGRGMTPDRLTLGLFADKTLLMLHLEWLIERAGTIHGGAGFFVRCAAMLCHPATGYLVTRPDIGQRMGFPSADAWREHLAGVQRWLRKEIEPKLVAAHKVNGRSRDQEKTIGPILAMARPLDALAHIVKKLEASLSSTDGLDEQRAARDVMLVSLLISNPLRALNLKRLTYLPDNTGHLRQTAEGGWKLFIPRFEFKNIHGAAKNRDYDMEIDPAVWPFISRYLRTYRPMFGLNRPELVFVSEKNPAREWKGLNKRFREITRTLLRGSGGIGPHSVRNMYATQVIKQTKGDYIAAAEALHDEPETVKENYWHLINSYADSARRAAVRGSMAILTGEAVPPTA